MYPSPPLDVDIEPELAGVSKTFAEIYQQARVAELQGLNHLVSMSLRKALEFLIKDYLIYKTPELADTIRGELLGSCINNHVSNELIKESARRANWLANDETHYTRKYEERDLKDLKGISYS